MESTILTYNFKMLKGNVDVIIQTWKWSIIFKKKNTNKEMVDLVA